MPQLLRGVRYTLPHDMSALDAYTYGNDAKLE